MKDMHVLALLVGAILCAETARSMMCFTCEQKRSNWDCLRLSYCPLNAQKCLTIRSLSGTGSTAEQLITKMCAPACPSMTKLYSSVYCCDHSWCNIWPPK